jgi:hypothetical protein
MSPASRVEGWETHLPAHRAKACRDLRVLVRRHVNLQVGQGVEVIELSPMLPGTC